MPVFTLIAGVNGVGKSSLAGLLLAQTNELGQFLNTDSAAAELGIGKVQAGKMTLNQIRHCLRWGMSFTQETTLSGHQPKETVQKAKDAGFRIELHYVALDTLEESLARIENRVRLGGHSIPKKDVSRRFQKRFQDLCAILPWCDEAKFYDNYNGFQLVAQYQNGLLIPVGKMHPLWLTELEKEYAFFQTDLNN